MFSSFSCDPHATIAKAVAFIGHHSSPELDMKANLEASNAVNSWYEHMRKP